MRIYTNTHTCAYEVHNGKHWSQLLPFQATLLAVIIIMLTIEPFQLFAVSYLLLAIAVKFPKFYC